MKVIKRLPSIMCRKEKTKVCDKRILHQRYQPNELDEGSMQYILRAATLTMLGESKISHYFHFDLYIEKKPMCKPVCKVNVICKS